MFRPQAGINFAELLLHLHGCFDSVPKRPKQCGRCAFAEGLGGGSSVADRGLALIERSSRNSHRVLMTGLFSNFVRLDRDLPTYQNFSILSCHLTVIFSYTLLIATPSSTEV